MRKWRFCSMKINTNEKVFFTRAHLCCLTRVCINYSQSLPAMALPGDPLGRVACAREGRERKSVWRIRHFNKRYANAFPQAGELLPQEEKIGRPKKGTTHGDFPLSQQDRGRFRKLASRWGELLPKEKPGPKDRNTRVTISKMDTTRTDLSTHGQVLRASCCRQRSEVGEIKHHTQVIF